MILLLVGQTTLYAQQWPMAQKLGSSDLQANDNFGNAVSVSGDYLFVGAQGEVNGPTVSPTGAAYVFERQADGTWQEVQKLTSPLVESLGYFGCDVAVAGEWALVGAYNEDHSGKGAAGRVYAYRRAPGGQWLVVDTLVAPDARDGDYFGFSLDMTEDYALIGAYQHDYDAQGQDSVSNAGAAYLYQRQPSGQWTMLHKLVSPERDRSHQFGRQVAIDDDALAIHAPGVQHPFTFWPNAGAVYAIHCNGACDFASVGNSDVQVVGYEIGGSGMDLADGWLVCGQPEEKDPPGGGIFTESNMGAVFFFRWENNQWTEQQKVYASDNKRSAEFGASVTLGSGVCAVGAVGEGAGPNAGTGAVYVLELQPQGQWQEVAKLLPTEGFFLDRMGNAAAISDRDLIAAAERADTLDGTYRANAGAIYVFRRDAPLHNRSLPDISGLRLQNPGTDGWLRLFHPAEPLPGCTLRLSSLGGQTILQVRTTLGSHWQHPLHALPSGVYLLRVEAPGYAPWHQRWVKP
ncbi:MAG: hypothetical protein OHK0039_09670 [Bacteroidia bacterium]